MKNEFKKFVVRLLKHFVRPLFLAGLMIVTVTFLGNNYARAASQITAKITLSDGSLCRFHEPFFNVNSNVSVELLDYDMGNVVDGPITADEFGFVTLDNAHSTRLNKAVLRINCGGQSEYPIYNVTSYPFSVNVTLSNHSPLISSAFAAYNGQSVKGVPPGSTVRLYARATDPDGFPSRVFYRWRTTDGTVIDDSKATAMWTLPNSKGLHFAYLLVSDGSGGYREQRITISTDAGVVLAKNKLTFIPIEPSDSVPQLDHFLTFKGSDSRKGACEYYKAIGAIGAAADCTFDGVPIGTINFGQWKNAHGFGASQGVTATYVNEADLNLTRDMHGAQIASDHIAYYVCNHAGPVSSTQFRVDEAINNAKLGNNLVACVAMDYSVTPGVNGNAPFTKFYTFGPAGDLLLSVNLDGRGEKFMPGTCVACHGGDTYSGRYPENGTGNPNLGAHFLPFDLGNFKFSSVAGSTKADSQANLKTLNTIIQGTNPTPAANRLITGWYCGFEFFDLCILPSPLPGSLLTQNESYTPPTWRTPGTDHYTYHSVVKRACRTCHVAMPKFDWDIRNEFFDPRKSVVFVVCNRRSMPNALITFNRFWNDPLQYNAFRTFFGMTDTDCPRP